MAEFNLAYDREILKVTVPDPGKVRSLVPLDMHPIENPHRAFLESLRNPVGMPPLSDYISPDLQRVLILVQDHTRVCGKEQIVSWLLDELNSFGIPDDRINILVALGSHKKPSDDVLRKSFGSVIGRVKIIHHDLTGSMIDCGTTSSRTPVRINARLKQADLVILYSTAVHHYFAGYGGGRKIIVPGLASLNTISANHSLVFAKSDEDGKGHGGRHPKVKSGILDGNPVSDDMLECARMALDGVKYLAISGVMTPSGEFAFLCSGDIDLPHRQACKFADDHLIVGIDEKADIVISSAGGYPKDLNVIQSHKGMDNACHALKPGGTLLYTMGCTDGYGNPAIEEFAKYDLPTIRQKLAEDYVVYGQTVYELKEKARKFRIVAISSLDPDYVRSLGMIPASGMDEAMSLVEDDIAKAGLVYHIPRADITLPRCNSEL